MGIAVEFNTDLCLRAFGTEGRKPEECLPERPEEGKTYGFLKSGQRNFWLEGEFPLRETKGGQQLSRPLASIVMVEAVHFLLDRRPFTKGKYRIVKVLGKDAAPYFEGYEKLNASKAARASD